MTAGIRVDDEKKDPVLSRHVGNLALVSGPSGLRPDVDIAEGQPIAAALAAMIAYDGVARIEHDPGPLIVLPGVGSSE